MPVIFNYRGVYRPFSGRKGLRIGSMEIPEIPESVTTIIFDLDGTLIDSEPLHACALSNLLEKVGLKSSPEELTEKFLGMPDDAVYYEIFNENSQIQLNQFIREKTNQIINLISQIPATEILEMTIPGAVDAVAHLHNQGYKLAVASASEPEVVQATINRMGIAHYLPIVRGRTFSFCSKPNPGIYFSVLRDYRVSSDQVLIFEDSLTGLQAATQTGSYVIRVGDAEDEVETEKFSQFEDLAVIDNFSWLISEEDESDSQEDEAVV